MERRAFLAQTAGLAAAAMASRAVAAPKYKGVLKKAIIVGKITPAGMKNVKDAGLDGVETTAILPPEQCAEGRKIAEDMGLKVHSVLRAWAEFNSTDPKQVKGSWDVSANALRAAAGYGADAILIVPCRTGGMKIPNPWELKIEFDPKTGHLTKVVDGDNAPYKAYMAAQDRAWDTSLEQVNKLVEVAKETKVVIALENVWNNLWLDPRHWAAFIDACNSPWVKAYFDTGNMVKYSPSTLWVRTLGKRLAKLHIKDYKLSPDGRGGGWADPLDGSVDWPDLRKALDEFGWEGWMTTEGCGLPLPEQRRRLEVIAAG